MRNAINDTMELVLNKKELEQWRKQLIQTNEVVLTKIKEEIQADIGRESD